MKIIVRTMLCLLVCLSTSIAQEPNEEWQRLVNQYFSLSRAQNFKGRMKVAEELLEFSEVNFGTEDPKTAKSVTLLAMALSSSGQLTEAEALYKRALAIREKDMDLYPLLVADCLYHLGALFSNQHRHAEAEPYFKRTLEIREKELPLHNQTVLMAMKSLAAVYHSQGKAAEWDILYRRALDITENTYGAGSPQAEALTRSWNAMKGVRSSSRRARPPSASRRLDSSTLTDIMIKPAPVQAYQLTPTQRATTVQIKPDSRIRTAELSQERPRSEDYIHVGRTTEPKEYPISFINPNGLTISFSKKSLTLRYSSIEDYKDIAGYRTPKSGDDISATGSVYIYENLDHIQIVRKSISPNGYKLIHPGIEARVPARNIRKVIDEIADNINWERGTARHNPVWIEFNGTVDTYTNGRIQLAEIGSYSIVELDTDGFKQQAIEWWLQMESEVEGLLNDDQEIIDTLQAGGTFKPADLTGRITEKFNNRLQRPYLFDVHYAPAQNLLELTHYAGIYSVEKTDSDEFSHSLQVQFLFDTSSKELKEVSFEFQRPAQRIQLQKK